MPVQTQSTTKAEVLAFRPRPMLHAPAFPWQARLARLCVAIIAATLLVPPLPVHAVTAATTLAESPLRKANPAKPNIVLTLDDAAHMGWEFAPDYVAYAGPSAYHCRDRRHCGGASAAPSPGYAPSQFDPPLRSSDYNILAYNPTIAYPRARRSDGGDLPCEGTTTACAGPWTAVHVDGFAGYPAANTGAVVNLVTNFPDTAWCWKSTPTTAEIQTAFTDGSVCRRNGLPYAETGAAPDIAPATSAGYNYPNGIDPANGQATSCAAGQQCRFLFPFPVNGNPHYYEIAQVGFCATSDAAGWGNAGCGESWNATARPHVRFGSGTFDPQAFRRVDIRPSGFLVNGVAAANPSGRTYAAEMANFAIWHAFHRTRMLALKTAAGIAFSTLGPRARVGLHTLGTNGGDTATFVNVADFDASRKETWFARMYATPVAPNNAAPVADAMWRIGELFANRNPDLPGAVDPLDSTTGKCQSNEHLLALGGYAGTPLNAAHVVGNRDRIVPPLPASVPGLAPGTAFPRPYYEGPTATSDTLADLAMTYWVQDLRPDLADQVGDAFAPWQHLSFHAFSLGARGTLDDRMAIDTIRSGAADWPVPNALGGPETIDDLLHAAVNGRGRFAHAANANDLAAAFASTLAAIADASGTGTGAAITVSSSTTGMGFAYRTSFAPGGWGDVRKYALDALSGTIPLDANGNPANAPLWSAAAQLDAQIAVTGTPSAQVAGWDVERKIVTINDATGNVVPFRVDTLSAGQRTSLTAGWQSSGWQPTAQQVLDYLRGDKSNEGSGARQFRVRSHLLGDIVHSAAVPVGAPNLAYDEAGNPGYAAYRATRRNRTPMVYVGANDGMLHAIVDADAPADAGKEAWAFIPKALFSTGNPNDAAHEPSPDFQLGALAYRPGGMPAYAHRFYVDATPRVSDVDFANTNTATPPKSGNDWRTVLIGGLGAGGRAVYALDVTNPVALTETESAMASSGRVLWEFTHANLGHVFDAPTLVKTRRYGWVALIASGHNNPGGDGKLFVVNPANGALLKTLSTGAGSNDTPSGLAAIRAYTTNRSDPYVEQAYGGDLEGNLWRFDLSGADESKWKVERIARLTDGSGKPQPITTGVRIELDPGNSMDRYLLVGTGKLLDQADLSDASTVNTMYAIRDGTRTAPEPARATPWSRADLNAVDATGTGGFGAPAPGTRGWYQDATDPSQKIVTDVHAVLGSAVFAFSQPSRDPCGTALEATLFARDFATGQSALLAPGGASTPGGTLVPSIAVGAGAAGINAAPQRSSVAGSAAVDARVAVTTLQGQFVGISIRPANPGNRKHRVSWRLINSE